jgi:hypothetical protein
MGGRIAAWAAVVFAVCAAASAVEKLSDHEVVLDAQGRLQSWTTYDHVIRGSVEYINNCPTEKTVHGDDPWYLITSKLKPNGEFFANQNNQAGNLYFAAETLARYYAYTGDRELFKAVQLLADRVLEYHTPGDWAWAHVPRTQDDTPDGVYDDDHSEPDKMAMAGDGYVRFYKLTGDKKYLDAALGIAKTLTEKVRPGDADLSPLPFRVNLKNGRVIDKYSAHMITHVMFFDTLLALGVGDKDKLAAKRDLIWRWVLEYPMKNNRWSGYYEDVGFHHDNLNQQSPMETARYMMRHPDRFPDMKEQVPALIEFVRNRFGLTKRFGASSICEQDNCFREMSSHTARYASVAALWFGFCEDPKVREEARAAFALSTYSAFCRYSQGERALNFVGLGYIDPWFSDSYFDYLPHFFDGMTTMPDMAPADQNHVLECSGTITKIEYAGNKISYETFEPAGDDVLRITFTPRVLADGKPLDAAAWQYGEFHGVPGVLRIHRDGAKSIVVEPAV